MWQKYRLSDGKQFHFYGRIDLDNGTKKSTQDDIEIENTT